MREAFMSGFVPDVLRMLRDAQKMRTAALWLVVAALSYTAVLCFVHTHATAVTNAQMAIADGAIVLGALGLAFLAPQRALWIVLLALAVNFLLVVLVSEEFNLKAVRDPLVLIAFAALGMIWGNARLARRAFIVASAIVVPIGLFELLAPALFQQVFDVLGFYMGRGVITAEQAQYQSSSFFVSGERADGRFLTSFLGGHRVSSVFLEPVSMGNFGALAAAFALSLGRAHWRLALGLGAVALFAILAADARFAAGVLALFLVARLVPIKWTTLALAPLPLLTVIMLIVVSQFVTEGGDTFPTRLALSGRLLADLDAAQLMGFAPGSISTVDSGYAYALTSFGLPLCLALWATFVAAPATTAEGKRYKLMLGIYACALLCISGSSLFALKTAALGWFAFGALASAAIARKPAPAPHSARTVPV